ncbi:STAS/SEC14 domain-containing protein [Shewanella sp. Isolate13]|uniref:STAS/SEC14 domain-containing protein n=1 Tax=Shewanella sp. Isolate13 TaxID=2908531 RepID=UPI001EFE6D08|nr:STAS/SEC14 domain-containing protein [Shewanella sp. Isolate13]MCG9728386.1 STAS/SEC14 domain-containing protein [Shewanella sp. Isolate13]
MLCKIPDIAKGVISLFASGRLSTEDYGQIMQPLIESYRDTTGKTCIYVEADVLLEGWQHESLAGSGEVQLPNFDALVLVGGPDWFGNAVRLMGPFMQGEVAWYPLEQKALAVEWIAVRTELCE